MRADAMDGSKSRLITHWSRTRTHPPYAKVLRLSQLRRLRECAQVAAVCYRVRASGVEFLLVRTNSGHWTFPKGNAEPGLTHAQAAALEAFEEAGVHGRMEEASFMQYVRRKRGAERDSAGKAVNQELAVQAHLCEVSRLEPPQESDRHPTWFSPEKAKSRLREDRSSEFAVELARVVDRAIARIKRLHSGAGSAR
jgi:8-oxo-dGTP pyrophosphatase MutT (NUDIX family)